jgi:hypothetical protein
VHITYSSGTDASHVELNPADDDGAVPFWNKPPVSRVILVVAVPAYLVVVLEMAAMLFE